MARCQHFKALQTNSYLGYLKARNKNLNIDGFQWPLGYVSLRLNRSQPYFTCLIPTPCVDISSLADMGPKTDILNISNFPFRYDFTPSLITYEQLKRQDDDIQTYTNPSLHSHCGPCGPIMKRTSDARPGREYIAPINMLYG
ncbi:hypothetical protein ACN38_g9852 [Penicillium nordicum]|uniref:Uncharacterized protein n=1 Tax=Penicillium nordicum TaxID=229535 RepID=A0A0N0RXZ6_9EURO|nr:hypothetical protein ACN38_g9852 [Penicillium nordicum]